MMPAAADAPKVYPPGPLPPLTADAPDELLLAALQRQPGALNAVQCQATAAYRAILATGIAAALGVDAFWGQAQRATAAAAPRGYGVPATHSQTGLAQLRIALSVRDTLEPIAADLRRISPSDGALLRFDPVYPAIFNTNIRVVSARYPGLAAWQARRDAEAAAADEAQRAERDRQIAAQTTLQDEARRVAVRDLVGRLTAAGVSLTASKKGIAARPAGLLTAEDRAALAAHRTELLELLAGPEELVA